MKRYALILAAIMLACIITASSASAAVTAAGILSKVKAAEAGFQDFKAELDITNANKKNVSGMGEGYADILKLEKGLVMCKKPDMIRYDGYAQGIKASYIQNGYNKLVLTPMLKHRESVKNAPGKRQDSLDLGFLSSKLWVDNKVTLVSTEKNGTVKLKFDPKTGGNDKRHNLVWIDPVTLKVLKHEKFRGSGEMRTRLVYGEFKMMGKLPIATEVKMYDGDGDILGTIALKNLQVNTGLKESQFPLK